MMKTRMLVDVPVIHLLEDETAEQVLVKFYRGLGWDGLSEINPCKVRTTEAIYQYLSDIMGEKCRNKLAAGLITMNYGPGVDEDIPTGKVRLIDGWLILNSDE